MQSPSPLLAEFAELLAEPFGEGHARALLASLRHRLENAASQAPRVRPPKAKRPQCPAVTLGGHRCEARRHWPKGETEPAPWCRRHLVLREGEEAPDGE